MKSFYVLTTTAALMTMMGAANADIPEPFNKGACIASANNEPKALIRCEAMNECYRNYSDSEGGLKGCYYEAEKAYKLATSGKLPVEAASVTTSPAASDYDMKPGKGFDEANQGRGQ